ncbi:MAG: hypothetical protein J0L57_05045 [Burkholderiales bacterium]|nr:hypothetical protein [Burkholderiales bacterium]
MLKVLEVAQLVLLIALFALAGQGLLYVLAGAKRSTNLFYQVLQIVSKPFTGLVRRLMPAKVSDQQVPVVTFFLLLLISFVVFAERGILMCEQLGYTDCRR